MIITFLTFRSEAEVLSEATIMMAEKHSTVTMNMASNFVLLCHLLSFDLDKNFPPLDGLFHDDHVRGVFY